MKRIWPILLGLLVLYFIFLIRQDIIDYLDLGRDKERVEKKLVQEEAEVAALKQRLSKLTSPDLLEEIARTKLGLIKKGEIAYKVIR